MIFLKKTKLRDCENERKLYTGRYFRVIGDTPSNSHCTAMGSIGRIRETEHNGTRLLLLATMHDGSSSNFFIHEIEILETPTGEQNERSE